MPSRRWLIKASLHIRERYFDSVPLKKAIHRVKPDAGATVRAFSDNLVTTDDDNIDVNGAAKLS